MLKFKENNGITLVSLIITIIILLVLAGITIGQLTGNGLFESAKTAKQDYETKANEEQLTIAEYSNEIDSYVNGGRATQEEINELRRQIEELSSKKSFEELTEYEDISIGISNRSSSVSKTFEVEANQEYYLVGYFVFTGGNNNNLNIENKMFGDLEITFSPNITIINQSSGSPVIKIKTTEGGQASYSFLTGTTDGSAHLRERVVCKLYK